MTEHLYDVDIIVPIYNVEKYIKKCIDSLIEQSYEKINIILVDDGSTDSSGNICNLYVERYNNVKIIHKKNGGLVSAWTTGLSAATSEWIVFVDGDDWIEINHIKELVNEQKKNNADVVVIWMKQVTAKEMSYIPFVIPVGCYKGEKLKKELYPSMFNTGGFEKRGVPFSRCGKLIKKDLIDSNLKYLYENATYEEDFNIIAPVLMDAKVISLIEVENAAYCYRRVEKSMLHGYSGKVHDSIKNVYPRLIKACKDKKCEDFILQIKAEYLSANVRQYTNELKNPNDYSTIRNNIKKIVDDRFLKDCMKIEYYKNYPFRYKLVIYALKHYGLNSEKIITRALRFVSSRRKQYE